MEWRDEIIGCLCAQPDGSFLTVGISGGVLGEGFPALALVPNEMPSESDIPGVENTRLWNVVDLKSGYSLAMFHCFERANAFVADSIDPDSIFYIEWEKLLSHVPVVTEDEADQIQRLTEYHCGAVLVV